MCICVSLLVTDHFKLVVCRHSTGSSLEAGAVFMLK